MGTTAASIIAASHPPKNRRWIRLSVSEGVFLIALVLLQTILAAGLITGMIGDKVWLLWIVPVLMGLALAWSLFRNPEVRRFDALTARNSQMVRDLRTLTLQDPERHKSDRR
jgi:hypothetical protein